MPNKTEPLYSNTVLVSIFLLAVPTQTKAAKEAAKNAFQSRCFIEAKVFVKASNTVSMIATLYD